MDPMSSTEPRNRNLFPQWEARAGRFSPDGQSKRAILVPPLDRSAKLGRGASVGRPHAEARHAFVAPATVPPSRARRHALTSRALIAAVPIVSRHPVANYALFVETLAPIP